MSYKSSDKFESDRVWTTLNDVYLRESGIKRNIRVGNTFNVRKSLKQYNKTVGNLSKTEQARLRQVEQDKKESKKDFEKSNMELYQLIYNNPDLASYEILDIMNNTTITEKEHLIRLLAQVKDNKVRADIIRGEINSHFTNIIDGSLPIDLAETLGDDGGDNQPDIETEINIREQVARYGSLLLDLIFRERISGPPINPILALNLRSELLDLLNEPEETQIRRLSEIIDDIEEQLGDIDIYKVNLKIPFDKELNDDEIEDLIFEIEEDREQHPALIDQANIQRRIKSLMAKDNITYKTAKRILERGFSYSDEPIYREPESPLIGERGKAPAQLGSGRGFNLDKKIHLGKNLYLDKKKLRKNVMSISDDKGRKIPNLKNMQIGSGFKKMLTLKQLKKHKDYKITPEEMEVYNKIMKILDVDLQPSKQRVINVFKDTADMLKRFEILKAQFDSGNENKDAINEMSSIVTALEKNGTITKELAKEFIEEFVGGGN